MKTGKAKGVTKRSLPQFIRVMTAERKSEPFDSDKHLFEIKWDGIRALAFIDAGKARLMSRNANDITRQYGELACLAELPAGIVLDGEIVVGKDGRPNFSAVLSRHHSRRSSTPGRTAAYVVFDVLYHDYEPVMSRPLHERRALLEKLLERAPRCVMLSPAMVGNGLAMFDVAAEHQMEGIVAKRLDSRYLAGRRSDAWVKVKRERKMACAIIGYMAEAGDLRSLALVGPKTDGEIVYVGNAGAGMSAAERARLLKELQELHTDRPMIRCRVPGAVWVEPCIAVDVRYLEQSSAGILRHPMVERVHYSARCPTPRSTLS